MPGKVKTAAKPPSKVAGVGDAIDQLERRRRTAGKTKASGRRSDLDLDAIR